MSLISFFPVMWQRKLSVGHTLKKTDSGGLRGGPHCREEVSQDIVFLRPQVEICEGRFFQGNACKRTSRTQPRICICSITPISEMATKHINLLLELRSDELDFHDEDPVQNRSERRYLFYAQHSTRCYAESD